MAEAESVGKLRAFNDMVAIETGKIKDTGLPAVRNSAQELNGAFSVSNQVISLKSALDDGEDALEDADGELKDAVEELAETAETLADDRLGKCTERINSAGDDFVEEAGAEADDLREAGSDVESDGFKKAESEITEAETILERTKDKVSAAFTELASHVQEVGDRFAGVLVRAGEKAGEAASEADAQTASVEDAGTEASDTLGQYASAAPEVYQSLEEAVSSFYEDLHDTLLKEGAQVVNGVGEALDALGSVVTDEVMDGLDKPFEIVLDDVLAPASSELDDWIEAVSNAKGKLGDFEAFTDEVRSAKVTAARIAEEINKSVGGGGG